MNTSTEKQNVRSTSEHGHFVKGAKKVINLDAINETFLVEGESVLETNNHTTLEMPQDCLITCQQTFDAFKNIKVKSRD